ncbi:MAG: lipid II flippase MurJ, partial [Planctomycetota bacterium]
MQPPAEHAGSASDTSEVKSSETSYRSVFVVGLLTLFSRMTGLVREATRAHFLGVSMASDAFQVAFQLPSLLRRLVGEGAVSSAIVPVLSEYA